MSFSLVRPALLTTAAVTLSIESARSQSPATHHSVAITFLANEGVMLSSGTSKVLIDGLFLKYETGFAVPADSTLAALERARPPFDAVDLVLGGVLRWIWLAGLQTPCGDGSSGQRSA